MKRPAETAGVATAIAAIIARIAGVDDPDVLTYLIIVVGAVPGAVTWIVELFRKR